MYIHTSVNLIWKPFAITQLSKFSVIYRLMNNPGSGTSIWYLEKQFFSFKINYRFISIFMTQNAPNTCNYLKLPHILNKLIWFQTLKYLAIWGMHLSLYPWTLIHILDQPKLIHSLFKHFQKVCGWEVIFHNSNINIITHKYCIDRIRVLS